MPKFLEIEAVSTSGRMMDVQNIFLNLDSIEYVFPSNHKAKFDDGTSCLILSKVYLRNTTHSVFPINCIKPYQALVNEIKELTDQK